MTFCKISYNNLEKYYKRSIVISQAREKSAIILFASTPKEDSRTNNVHQPFEEPPETGGIDRFADVTDLPTANQIGELWYPTDGIMVARSLANADLQGFRPNPIFTETAHMGDVRLLSTRTTFDTRHERIHRLYLMERYGFQHAVEITDPALGNAEFLVLSFPGFTETIEGGIRQDMHAQLAAQFPMARIASIGSNGVGVTGDHYGWNERSLHGIDSMGSQRLHIAMRLGGSIMPLFLKGTSMGTVIAQRMAHENFYGRPEDGSVDIRGQFYLAPAIVDPKNIPRDMALRFIPAMIGDLFKELALKTPPHEVGYIFRAAREYGLSKRDTTAMLNQLIELLHGTSEEAMSRTVAAVPTVVVAGENDPLAQFKMWDRLRGKHGDKIHIEKIKGRGHGLPMRPGKSCEKIQRSGQFLVNQALQKPFRTAS
jgi:hypothetical protein